MSDIGHNADREQFEEQMFLNGFRQIKGIKAEIAGSMGEASAIYKRLKELGFTKADVAWAFDLEDKNSAEVIETMRRRLRIAKMLGHGIARQFEMFDTDRTPVEDVAYEDGLAAGKLRKDMGENPHDLSTDAGQAWQRGFNDGTAFINKALSDELIKGDDPFADEAA